MIRPNGLDFAVQELHALEGWVYSEPEVLLSLEQAIVCAKEHYELTFRKVRVVRVSRYRPDYTSEDALPPAHSVAWTLGQR